MLSPSRPSSSRIARQSTLIQTILRAPAILKMHLLNVSLRVEDEISG